MQGGIRAWEGLTAEGPPEAGITYFAAGTGAADMASLAWALEEGTRRFYGTLSERSSDPEAMKLFGSLVHAEERHKKTLADLNDRLSSEPVNRMYDDRENQVLEGGMEMEKALQWTQGRSVTEILELGLELEANAYDRYLKMLDAAADSSSREVFRTIAKEEKQHLERLAGLMDERLESAKRQ